MATAVETGNLIVQTAGICGGRPRIAGTGVSVRRVAAWHRKSLEPEEIAKEIGHLTLTQVHAALTYYRANRLAIDADLAADEHAAKAEVL